MQGLEYLSTTFEWSRHIQQLATIGLIVGLPIVLVLACTTAIVASSVFGAPSY